MRHLHLLGCATVLLLLSCQSDRAGQATSAAAGGQQGASVGKELTIGQVAPDVELPLQTGKTVKLSDFKGRAVVLYFYPKDDTPGCRIEAQGFRDLHTEFVAANTVVLGVSTQDEASHQAFIQKENLPFDLAIDRGGKLAAEFGVPMNGSVTARQTVLIDNAGNVAAKWVDVTPRTHAAEVLAASKTAASNKL